MEEALSFRGRVVFRVAVFPNHNPFLSSVALFPGRIPVLHHLTLFRASLGGGAYVCRVTPACLHSLCGAPCARFTFHVLLVLDYKVQCHVPIL